MLARMRTIVSETMAGEADRRELGVRFATGIAGMQDLRGVWEALAPDVGEPGFQHQYAWYESFLNNVAQEPDTALFAVVSRGALPVAIVPFVTGRASVFPSARVLQLPDHPHLCLADAILRQGEDPAELIRRVVWALRRSMARGWDVLLFPEVSASSAVNRALTGPWAGFSVREFARESHSLPNAGGYDATAARFPGPFRRDLRRKARRLAETGAVEYCSVEEPEALEKAFRDFLAVEASGWKGENGTRTAIQCNPELVGFYGDLIRCRSVTLRCVINLLYLDGVCIAGEFCLYSHGVLTLLKIGYDESRGNLSPGNVLLDAVLRDWCERPGVRAISLLGDAVWQRSWHPYVEPVYRYWLFNRSLRGLIAWVVRHIWVAARRALMVVKAVSAWVDRWRGTAVMLVTRVCS